MTEKDNFELDEQRAKNPCIDCWRKTAWGDNSCGKCKNRKFLREVWEKK